ncbi:cytochrome C oxidase subunit IV family protein [bacterium]|nr:cytochrome C oxidase subunit IV family protein [bacterium]
MGAHSGHWKRLGDGKLTPQDFEDGLGHILSQNAYRNTLLALLFLTIVTVAVSRIDFGVLNIVVAIGIASIKALLVGMFFMHLKFEKRLIIGYAIYPLVLLFLLIFGTLGDHATRVSIKPQGAEFESFTNPLPALNQQHDAHANQQHAPAHPTATSHKNQH